ncbi:MAG: M20 family metallopeptidase [Candidatus Omnitrophota bacterium]|nr:M20 family metallopeptidase [Candidatus Omnitrophota bacterium]
MVNKKRLIKLTRQLIRINSENPPGDEKRIAEFLRRYLQGLGLRVKIYEFKKGRSNLVANFPCAGRKKSLLLTPHLDTVPAGKSWSLDPFSARIKRGRIYGLGATDCKGNLAAAVEALNSILEEKKVLDYNLILAATADEECGSALGLLPLLKKGILHADAAVVLDADDFNIIVAQKGLLQIKVRIAGKRAHAAYPRRGVNAIDKAVDIIRQIRAHKFSYRKNKYLKGPTVNAGTIRGGDKVNIVADWCEFELDFRFLPGMSAGKILKQVKEIIGRRTKNYRLDLEGLQRPYSVSTAHPLVLRLKDAMSKFRIEPNVTGSEGATTITFFQDAGIPAIATGFGSSERAHMSDEYADIARLYKGAQVLEKFLKERLWKD